MMMTSPTVFIVDDDEAIRKALRRLVESVGLGVETFASAEEFLETFDRHRPGCLISDLRMPGLSGIDLQHQLHELDSPLPVILLTGHGEVPTAVRALKEGALDFIQKPFSEQMLLDRVREAIEHNRQVLHDREERADVASKIARLTPREREIMDHVVQGKSNKQIAADLSISEKTVEFHRANLMEKIGAGSVADLVRVALKAREA